MQISIASCGFTADEIGAAWCKHVHRAAILRLPRWQRAFQRLPRIRNTEMPPVKWPSRIYEISIAIGWPVARETLLTAEKRIRSSALAEWQCHPLWNCLGQLKRNVGVQRWRIFCNFHGCTRVSSMFQKFVLLFLIRCIDWAFCCVKFWLAKAPYGAATCADVAWATFSLWIACLPDDKF